MSWRSFVREPLVHFLAIGAVLFAIDAWRAPADVPASPPPDAAPAPVPPPAAGRTIVVDDRARLEIADRAARKLGRPPTAAELATETEAWIDEQVLFREAVARGLDRDDPVIHQRIASRMAYVLEQGIVVPEPTEPELRAWFDAHRDELGAPDRVDFTHVFVAGTDASAEARRDGFATALAAGASPDTMGDRFSGGRRYRGRKPADLAAAFGDEFVAGLAAQAPGTWVKRRSRHGLHLVRLDRAESGRAADFAAARLEARRAIMEERKGRELRASLDRLRAGWQITR